MVITKKMKEHAVSMKLVQLTELLCRDMLLKKEEALRYILQSETYRVLTETDNGLYLESIEYVYEKLKLEVGNNKSEWEKY